MSVQKGRCKRGYGIEEEGQRRKGRGEDRGEEGEVRGREDMGVDKEKVCWEGMGR